MSEPDGRIRTLLEQEERDAAAPAAVRLRGREHLRRTIEAGAMATAMTGAAAAAAGPSATAGAGSLSLGGTLITALTIGICSGLVSISPTDDSRVVSGSPSAMTARPTASVVTRAANLATASQATPPSKTSPNPIAPGDESWTRTRESATEEVVERAATPVPRAAKTPAATAGAVVHALVPTTPPQAIPLARELPRPRRTSIMRETTLLGHAQKAFNGGKHVLTLGLLNQYATEFPDGTLAEEAMVSRIVTYCAMGRRSEGQGLAAVFIRQYPNSALAGRVVGACQPGAQPASSAHPPFVAGEPIQ